MIGLSGLTVDPGDWIILVSGVLIAAATALFFALTLPRTASVGWLGAVSAALTIISVGSGYGFAYLGKHHNAFEWMSNHVLGAMLLLMFSTFFYGLIGAVVSALRAVRQRRVNPGILSPWIVYGVIIAIGVSETLQLL